MPTILQRKDIIHVPPAFGEHDDIACTPVRSPPLSLKVHVQHG